MPAATATTPKSTPQAFPRHARKRLRCSPANETPKQSKRIRLRERLMRPEVRRLTYSKQQCEISNALGTWSQTEVKALVEFVLFYAGTEERWPQHKRGQFWKSAGKFVHERSHSSGARTGMMHGIMTQLHA